MRFTCLKTAATFIGRELVRDKLNTTDILSILRQMPSSILFKGPESTSIHVSKGFERDFGIRQSAFVDTHSFTFFDLETKYLLPLVNNVNF